VEGDCNGVISTAMGSMSIQSGLLGAAVTVMGAVSLSTPDVIQIDEEWGHHVFSEKADVRLSGGLFKLVSSGSFEPNESG